MATTERGRCIFCDRSLDEKTKPEHILHDAFGGRKTTRRIICSECNNCFGSGIDDTLTNQFGAVRNLLQLQSGSGDLAPMLRRVKAGNQVINVRGDGEMEMITKPFVATKLPNGSFNVHLNVRSLEEIDRLIPHIAASIGIPEPRVREQMLQASGKQVEHRPSAVLFDLQFGGIDAVRSAAKSCLVLWALHVGNEEARSDAYAGVRAFINGADHEFLTRSTQLDSRPPECTDQLAAEYGPLFNLIYARSDD